MPEAGPLAIPISAALLWLLWRRGAASHADATLKAVLSVVLIASALAAFAVPPIVFQGLRTEPGPYHNGAWASLAAGSLATVALLTLALVGDRPRARRRCPGCWYDMSATRGLVCPECGVDARDEQRLHLPRRRKLAIAASLMPFVAGASLYGTWLSRQPSWTNAVPTPVLILASPFLDYRTRMGFALDWRCGSYECDTLAASGPERFLQAQISRLVLRVRHAPAPVLFHAGILDELRREDDATEAALVSIIDDPDADIRACAIDALFDLKRRRRGGTPPASLLARTALRENLEALASAERVLGLYSACEASRTVLFAAAALDDGTSSSLFAMTALAELYPNDAEVQRLIARSIPGNAIHGPSVALLRTLRSDDAAAFTAGPDLLARRVALYTPEVRRAIIDLARENNGDSTLARWLLPHPAFTAEEHAELKQIFWYFAPDAPPR